MMIGLLIIAGIILIKYKPLYKVTIDGEIVGYLEDKNEFENRINEYINTSNEECIAFKTLETEQSYNLEFVLKEIASNEDEIFDYIIENTQTVYTMYAILVNEDITSYVETEEEAKQAVEKLNTQYKGQNIEIGLRQIYSTTKPTVVETEIAVAEISNTKINPIITSRKATEVRKKATTNTKTTTQKVTKSTSANGVTLQIKPVSGTITSRYGVRSSIRKSTHTGLDIAAPTGTAIKSMAAGTVIFSGNSGSYGKMIKVSHGNGVETWYAHCNKLYYGVGQQVSAGQVIAEVGSTGNSTGPHLHLEIRVNGKSVNPQKYIY